MPELTSDDDEFEEHLNGYGSNNDDDSHGNHPDDDDSSEHSSDGGDTDASMPSLKTSSDEFEEDYENNNSSSDDSDNFNDDNGSYSGDNFYSSDENYEDDERKDDIEMNYNNYKIKSYKLNDNFDNNLLFDYQRIGLGKTYISGASAYPPELNSNATIGAISGDNARITNKLIDGKLISSIQDGIKIINLVSNNNEDTNIFISDSSINIINNNNNKNIGVINGTSKYEPISNVLEQVVTNDNVIEIKDTTRKWWIHVNVSTESGEIIKIKLFADPGANAACVKTSWALKHFRSFIQSNTKTNTLYTPNGSIIPKYVLYLSFPTRSGIILKAKLYLVDKLPVNILADINMLESFGYKFIDGTPDIFRNYSSNNYVDMDLNDDRKIDETSSYKQFENNKNNINLNITNCEDGELMTYNKLYGNNKLLYDTEFIETKELNSTSKNYIK